MRPNGVAPSGPAPIGPVPSGPAPSGPAPSGAPAWTPERTPVTLAPPAQCRTAWMPGGCGSLARVCRGGIVRRWRHRPLRRPGPGGLAAARGPSRCHIVPVRTVTMSHRGGCGAVTGAAAARREGPPGPAGREGCARSRRRPEPVRLRRLPRRADLKLSRSATDRLGARRGVIVDDAGGVDLGDVRF